MGYIVHPLCLSRCGSRLGAGSDSRGETGIVGWSMGWQREVTFGEYELRLAFSRSGSFQRRAGRDPDGHGIARLGGRHVRVAFRHRTWNDLTEAERWDRIHGYH